MTSREELIEAARTLGAMVAKYELACFDVAEHFAAGYGEALTARLDPESKEHAERSAQGQLSALSELRTVANEVITRRVDDARERSVSWEKIGDALDISRQAAHERFSKEHVTTLVSR